jgi:outer membrane lipoprotein SlyB
MDCIPVPNAINNMKSADETMDYLALADAAVKEFFKKFEREKTVAACAGNVGDGIFTAAEIYATDSLTDKFRRAYEEKVVELVRNASLAEKKKACEGMYDSKVMSAKPVFEESLSSCHICRTQKIQAKSGTSWGQNFAKAGIGGLASGASAGSGFGPWGAAIGGAVGLISGGLSTIGSGEKIEEQELEVCEDVRL